MDFCATVVACLGVIFKAVEFFPSTPGSKLIRLISQICPSVVMGAVERRTAPAQPLDPDWVEAGRGVFVIKPARISQGATSSGAEEALRPQTRGRAHGWAQIKLLEMMDMVIIHCCFLKCWLKIALLMFCYGSFSLSFEVLSFSLETQT